MITVHHLNFSRSTRVLWLLEEIGQDYAFVAHTRTPGFRAPESLRAVHPLGKAPVIEDDGLVIAESASILTYLNDRYADGRFAPAPGTAAAAIHDEWLHYAEGSAAFPILLTVIGGLAGGLSDAMAGIAGREAANSFAYVAGRLGGAPYLMGDAFTIADIQLAYLLDVARAAGMLAAHPTLIAYVDGLKARPAFVRAIEIGGLMTLPRR